MQSGVDDRPQIDLTKSAVSGETLWHSTGGGEGENDGTSSLGEPTFVLNK